MTQFWSLKMLRKLGAKYDFSFFWITILFRGTRSSNFFLQIRIYSLSSLNTTPTLWEEVHNVESEWTERKFNFIILSFNVPVFETLKYYSGRNRYKNREHKIQWVLLWKIYTEFSSWKFTLNASQTSNTIFKINLTQFFFLVFATKY